LDVNLFDTLAVTHAFPPPMRHRRAGRIATIIRSDRWEEPVSTDSTAASPPSTQGEDLDPRRWLAHLVDEVERHEAEEHVEKQVGELGEQQPTEDLPLDEQGPPTSWSTWGTSQARPVPDASCSPWSTQ
jgi:hypothetical protein